VFLQDSEERLVIPRLGNEVYGSAPHGFDGQFNGSPSCHDYDRERRVEPVEAFEEIQTLAPGCRVPGIVQVEKYVVEDASCRLGEYLTR
jgi:hypothetical protein